MIRLAAVLFSLFLLLGCVFAPQPSPYPYIAAFLDAEATENCKFFFRRQVSSESEVLCDHSTIKFNPKDMAPYLPYMGNTTYLTLIGVALDSHAQALLISAKHGLQSTNSYPHITVDAAKDGPYSALYSNVLWTRFVKSHVVSVISGRDSKPTDILINGGKSMEANVTLPPFYSLEDPFSPPSHKPFPSSNASVMAFPSSLETTFLATICLDRWFVNGVCTVPPNSGFN